MTRSLALMLTTVLLGAAPGAPAGMRKPDRVAELAGTWTCRTPAGTISKMVFQADGGGVTGDETMPGAGTAHDRFTPDPNGGWRVERASSSARAFAGSAPRWTTDPWIIASTASQGWEMRYERIDDATFRRTFAVNGRPYAGEVCAKGDAPPDPALCAVADVPPSVVHAVEPDTPQAAMESRISGTVHVRVSLDAAGNVVDAAIQSSPSVVLNAASIAAARRSTYRPALHDCKPVPSQYIFSVEYIAG